ncbi:MAG: glycoside hydrolase family 47 protein [Bacteroidota bacterium]
MKTLSFLALTTVLAAACTSAKQEQEIAPDTDLAREIKSETLRVWEAYKEYAWGHDVLRPLSQSYSDWYEEPLYISPIDAYSTLKVMGLASEAAEIEQYVVDSLDFDKDIFAKVFEVNIRILGGLLSMYELSRNEAVLAKAQDFADRMMPAFDSPTGIPYYWVNLKTGAVKGDTVNVAEAATYTFEMGVLSYYTQDPKYYEAGRRATLAIHEHRSDIGLIGDIIEVQSGQWVSTTSHICAGVDSYYEYLYKSYRLFGDEELGRVWRAGTSPLHKYLAEEHEGRLWYGRADMHTGERVSSVVTLYDAFFPAILALTGDVERAEYLQATWQWLWNQHGLEPMIYDYRQDTATWPVYDLNPEIMESAYYLFHITGDSTYHRMNEGFWADLKTHCRTDVAFTSVQDVTTMEQRDYMPTFFFAETLKYLYLTFSNQTEFPFEGMMFNTEAHPFFKANFDPELVKVRLKTDTYGN